MKADPVSDLQLSRVQQGWLMMALLVSAAPIWVWLPFWVPMLTLIGIGWRSAMLWRGSVKPSRVMMIMLAVTLIAADLFTYWPPVGLEPMTALLLTACCLKYLEMRRLRDARLLICLCYFIAGIQLIYAAEIYAFVLALISVLITLSAQNILQRSPTQQFSLAGFSVRPLLSAGRLILFSIPLMLVIFIFAPRLPSFWVVPAQQEAARTGVSDSMNPGSIGSLTRSDELAFRVSFNSAIPPRSSMYWRGVVLSDYDGSTWRNGPVSNSQNSRRQEPSLEELFTTFWPDRPEQERWQSEIEYGQRQLSYSVYLEPSHQRWLFAISAPVTQESGLGMTQDLRLVSRLPIRQRTKYEVFSYPEYVFQAGALRDRDRDRNLSLPEDYNPRALALGREWQAQGLSADQVVRRIFTLFNQQFTYTLDPGTYGLDAVDEFLFDRQRGFCEHFASAAVILLRAAGVPARIVTGYQGGERSPYNDYVLVHQYDAHAWAEYWQQGQGWVRIDPTNAVAPERIEMGARDLFESDQNFLADSPLSLNRFQDVAWANWLRLRMDNAEYLWARWVLGYDGELQLDFLESVFGKWGLSKLALVLSSLALIGLSSVWLYFRIKMPARSVPLVEKRFGSFCKMCETLGIDIGPATTPAHIAKQAEKLSEDRRSNVQSLSKLFERQLFGGQNLDSEIGVLMRRLKAKLLSRPTGKLSAPSS